MTKNKIQIEEEYNELRKEIKPNTNFLNLTDYLKIRNFKAQICVETNKEGIKKKTQEALRLAKDEKNLDNVKEALRLLCDLDGVAVPIASAILHFVYPERYAIMDKYCWEKARKYDKKLSEHYGDKEKAIENYLKYLDIIRKVAKKAGKSLREIEWSWFNQERKAKKGEIKLKKK